MEPHTARNAAFRFRQHSVDMLHQMAPHQGDEKKLIAVATQGRRELEELWSRERAERRAQKARRGDGFHADAHPRDGSEPPAT